MAFKKTATKGKRKSRYAGLRGRTERDPAIGTGVYRVRVDGASRGNNPTRTNQAIILSLRIIEAAEGSTNEADTDAVVIFFDSTFGLEDIYDFARRAAGFGPTIEQRAAGNVAEIDDEAKDMFLAFEESIDVEGCTIDKLLGDHDAGPDLTGRLVDVEVRSGKPRLDKETGEPTGEFWPVYVWSAVPDEDQEVTYA